MMIVNTLFIPMMMMIDVLRPLCARGRLNGPSDLQKVMK